MLWYVAVRLNGGGGGIRTLEGLSPLPVFKTGAFNRSATPPQIEVLNQPYVNLISQPSYRCQRRFLWMKPAFQTIKFLIPRFDMIELVLCKSH